VALTAGVRLDVSSDGRFLINTVVEESVTSPITLLLNWKTPKVEKWKK
jgi:hypothetical protein